MSDNTNREEVVDNTRADLAEVFSDVFGSILAAKDRKESMKTQAWAPKKPEPEEHGRPTPEQLAHINGYLERPPIYDAPNSATRVPIGNGYKIATPVYKMLLDGRIGQPEYDAAVLLHRDFAMGHIVPGLTAKYGERMGHGGTPIAQQAGTERLSPEERRTFHHTRYINAMRYVNHPRTCEWLERIVCVEEHCTLEEVGRDHTGFSGRTHCTGAGVGMVKTGLEQLATYYGTNSRR